MMVQNLMIGLAYYSVLYYLPLFYQIVRQMTVVQSALMILPVVLPQSLASIASGQYMSRTNRYGELIWAGFSLWVVAAAVESRFSRTFPLAGIIVTLVIQGIGVGFTFQPSKVHSDPSHLAPAPPFPLSPPPPPTGGRQEKLAC